MRKKICKKCGKEKPSSKFYKNREYKDEREKVCKACRSVRFKELYQKNPDKARRSRYQKNFGITLADYDEMFAQQQGKCAICGTTIPGGDCKHFSVDHDHVTGLVRGLLCVDCNHGLGFFKDNIKALAGAVLYLSNNQQTETTQ